MAEKKSLWKNRNPELYAQARRMLEYGIKNKDIILDTGISSGCLVNLKRDMGMLPPLTSDQKSAYRKRNPVVAALHPALRLFV